MSAVSATGIFGKLPAHGDFVHRHLSSQFMGNWDTWLQTFIGSTQERLGESWLEIYLTSPIWRFCLSSGVVDDHCWAGVLLPSVDRVGRYFPLTLIRKLSATSVPTEFICTQDDWFASIEAAALEALEGHLQADQLIDISNQTQPHDNSAYLKQRALPVEAGVVVDLNFEDTHPLGTMPHFLDAFVNSAFASYSIWTTAGSARVEPCTFLASGLPPVAGSAAMMDGLWDHWEWSVPVHLKAAPMPQGEEPTGSKPREEFGASAFDEPLGEPEAAFQPARVPPFTEVEEDDDDTQIPL